MQPPPFLRIEWKVAPKASAFLDALRDRVAIAPTVSVAEDFTNLQALPRKQQEKCLRELDQRGQTIAGRTSQPCTWQEGWKLPTSNFVASLRGGSQS